MNFLRVWQINLHHCRAASLNLEKEVDGVNQFIFLAQEPWIHKHKICGIPSGWTIFQDNHSIHPRACILTAPSVPGTLLSQFSTGDMVAVLLENSRPSERPIVLVSCYLPYEGALPPPNLQELVNFCRQGDYGIAIGCDANAHHTGWGSSDVNPRGEALAEFLAAAGLHWCNVGCTPTFRVANRSEVIDITLVDGHTLNRVSNWRVSENPSLSDHAFITFNLHLKISGGRWVRNKETNWETYRQSLAAHLPSHEGLVDSVDELDAYASLTTEAMVRALEAACPRKWVSHRCRCSPWWTPDLTTSRRQVRGLLRRATRSNLLEDWASYRDAQRSYKRDIEAAKRNSWKNFCSQLNEVGPAAKLIRLLKKGRRSAPQNLRRPDGSFTAGPTEALELLLDSVCPRDDRDVDPPDEHSALHVEPEEVITPDELTLAVGQLNVNKSPGPDNVTPAMLKSGWDLLLPSFIKICRGCLRFGTIPKCWKRARMVFIPKTGRQDLENVKAYRPITLTSFQLKLLEKVILRHLLSLGSVSEAIHKNQHAYRAGSSTDSALHALVSRVEESVAGGEFALGVFLDIRGAFDSVNLTAITGALRGAGVGGGICSLISSLLRHREVEASWNGASCCRVINRGCPQGGVLSPLLWNLVMGQLLHAMDHHPVFAQAYADDIALLVRGRDLAALHNTASACLNIADQWAVGNGLAFSPSKSEVTVFTWRRKWILPPLLLQGVPLPRVTRVKYLGVTLDHKLKWGEHVRLRSNLALGLLAQVGRAVGPSWGASPKIISWAYQSLILPTLEYGCVVWVGSVDRSLIIRLLARVQRLACCLVTSAFPGTPTSAMEALLSFPPLPHHLKGRALLVKHRLQRTGRWVGVEVVGRRSLDSHVRELCDAGQNIPELHMPADSIVPQQLDHLGCSFLLQNREEATLAASELSPGCLNCFTDGSRQNGQAGAGYVVYNRGEEWLAGTWSLGSHSTVFQAELDAICRLAVDLSYRNISGAEVIIHCDSKAAILSLQSSMVRSKTVLSTRSAVLDLMQRGNHITIQWVPGHADVLGNERADELAKTGSSASFIGAEPALPLPQCSIARAVWQRVDAAHARNWNAGQTGRFTHSLLSAPDRKLSGRLLALSRGRIKSITRMLTLHNGLNEHMCRIGRRPNPLCPRCGEGPENPTHVFEHCVTLVALKFSIFGSVATTLSEVVGSLRLDELSRFISSAALSC